MQKEPFSPKLTKFLEAKGSDAWVNDLNRAFDQFFIDRLNLSAVAKSVETLSESKVRKESASLAALIRRLFGKHGGSGP
jgi:hypothetical protein